VGWRKWSLDAFGYCLNLLGALRNCSGSGFEFDACDLDLGGPVDQPFDGAPKDHEDQQRTQEPQQCWESGHK
jgi:hypothetical protein